jgi:anti-sigma B factor antagonist
MSNVANSMEWFGDLEIRALRDGQRYVIALVGELDLDGVDRVAEHLRRAEATDATQIVLDLAGLQFIDSSGVRLVLEADARSRADGSRLRFIRGPAAVQRVFVLSGLEDRLPWSGPG